MVRTVLLVQTTVTVDTVTKRRGRVRGVNLDTKVINVKEVCSYFLVITKLPKRDQS
jgi:hypothetical protein